jgi:hypothetical protein
MKPEFRKKLPALLISGLIAGSVTFFSKNPEWVEDSYANGLYPFLSNIQRTVFGIFPFSLGDIIYTSIILFLTWRIFRFVLKFKKQENKKSLALNLFLTIITVCLWVYSIFYLLWGLNYYREGVSSIFNLPEESVDKKEIILLTIELKDSLNKCAQLKSIIPQINHDLSSYKSGAVQSYKSLEEYFPELIFKTPSFKASLFGEVVNYMGIQGYYNPFTGESQINTRVPGFILPFVSCHEIAHQLGFASESEANFVGFLASKHSDDARVRYSAYFNMFMYAAAQLRKTDTAEIKRIIKQLHPDVNKDLRLYFKHISKYEGWLQDGSGFFYDIYLKQNKQRNGVETYGEVTAWLVSYKKKYKQL